MSHITPAMVVLVISLVDSVLSLLVHRYSVVVTGQGVVLTFALFCTRRHLNTVHLRAVPRPSFFTVTCILKIRKRRTTTLLAM